MMLPHVPQDIPQPQLEAVTLLVNGVPSHIRQYVPLHTLQMTIGGAIDDILEAEMTAQNAEIDGHANHEQAPVDDDAGQPEPQYVVGPLLEEEPIQAMPEQMIPAQEAEDPLADDDDDDVVPLEPLEDPPVPIIVISSDDEDGDGDDFGCGDDEMPDEIPNDEDDPEEFAFEDEPHEIIFDEGDWDVDSDSNSGSDISMITIELVI